MSNTCNPSTCDNPQICAATIKSLTNGVMISYGLSTVGSAAGLIYGIATKQRWWAVLLFMFGGGMVGSGLGWAIEAGKPTINS